MKQSNAKHIFQNAFLLCLSLCLAPATMAVVLAATIYNYMLGGESRARHTQPKKRILVTGVSMSKGMELARLFHQQGHMVVGADVDALACGRASRAIRKFHRLPASDLHAQADEASQYVEALLHIVKTENIDLWVSVSGVGSAVQDSIAKGVIERLTKARAIQFDSENVKILDAKDTFIEHVRKQGLRVPDSHRVESKDGLISFLRSRGSLSLEPDSIRYLIKPVGVDDAARLDMPLLPLTTETETLSRIDALSFSSVSSFIAQEFIQGEEYCTHSMVVRGRVVAFVACPSADILMHYTALPETSSLTDSMRRFTMAVAQNGGDDFTGHLSFDFMVKTGEDSSSKESEQIYPIECNPRVHTAIVLFRDTPQLADLYLSVLDPDIDAGNEILYPQKVQRYYWLGQDLVEKLFCPMYRMICHGTGNFQDIVSQFLLFAEHVLYWKDGTFVMSDPWPFWWLYHVQWPARLIGCLMRGTKWEKANVSTGKMFKTV
ncbi:hypothetical protein LLEC1_04634 [Akanthomyces lecanii]|uniref:ATP-grasp domain-containing protein n=1 Tax=Cordyceps confragosa TaxID=2714763 RepID=A0A179IVC7_CORDF|nr:hypothetical protein LLEC1_04634 [Akanthomyces lecanii]